MPRRAAKLSYYRFGTQPVDDVPSDPETIKAERGLVVIGSQFFSTHVTFQDGFWVVKVADMDRDWGGYRAVSKYRGLKKAIQIGRRLERFRPPVWQEEGELFPEEARSAL